MHASRVELASYRPWSSRFGTGHATARRRFPWRASRRCCAAPRRWVSPLPSGVLAAQLQDARREYHDKLSGLSRDIAIKQAELEQANVKHALEQGVTLEGRLIEYANNIEQRAFDAARAAAQNAVEIYNAQVAAFKVNLERYTTLASVYNALIEGEKAKVDAYRAEVDAERTKAEVNRALIEQQRAQIDVRATEIKLYETQLGAVQSLISVEKLKVEAFGERIRAYVAELNAETVKVEVFKAQNDSNRTRMETFKSEIEAYGTKLKALGDVAVARANVYDAQLRGYAALTQRYATAVTAEAERVRANVSIGQLKVDAFKAEVEQAKAHDQVQIENYRALIGLYDSNKSLSIQRVKLMSENYFALRNLVAEASKVAAQVNAQLAASAYGTINARADIQSSDSISSQHQIQYSYAGNTSADVAPKTDMPLFT